MGWKTLKNHYRIGHSVHVTEKGICIGSPYIPDIIIIGLDGKLVKEDDGRCNEDLKRYMAEFKLDPAKLREVVQAKDTFSKSIPVFTYDGGNIIEKQCEKLGWPNVTHDGEMMYANMFSANKATVVKWAKENATGGIQWRLERIEQLKSQIAEIESGIAQQQANLAKLESDYPTPA